MYPHKFCGPFLVVLLAAISHPLKKRFVHRPGRAPPPASQESMDAVGVPWRSTGALGRGASGALGR